MLQAALTNVRQVFFTVYCVAVIDISTRVTSTHKIVSYNDALVSISVGTAIHRLEVSR